MADATAVCRGAIGILSGRSRGKGRRRAQEGGGLWAAGGEHVVDQLSGACGSAQVGGFEGSLLCPDGVSGVEDQLLAQLVDRGGANEHGRACGTEVMQDALDRAGEIMRIVWRGRCLGQFLLAASREVTVATDRGAGEGE